MSGFVGKLSGFGFHYVSANPPVIATETPVIFLDRAGRWWITPKGFHCDGQSTPSFLWPFFGHPLEAQAVRAAVSHDHAYRKQDRTRRLADAMYREALLVDGATKREAWAKWVGLRIFGWWAWRGDGRRDGRK